jgi:hypothetical protein
VMPGNHAIIENHVIIGSATNPNGVVLEFPMLLGGG